MENSVIPKHYDLYFEPNFKTFKYYGKETISLKINKPSNTITLDSRDLQIKKVKLTQNSESQEAKIKLTEKTDSLTLKFPKKFKSGHAELFIEFSGTHNDQLSGFYRSSYKNKGKTEYLLTTQFEAPYARQAFPCFDHPGKKATFSVTMKVPKNMKTISNMPIQNSKSSKDTKIVSFEKTPKMSTYLLYMGVGNFDSISSNLGKTKINIYTVPGKAKLCKLSMKFTKQFLKYFEEYSKIPYPLPKLDLIAIPDFAAGAMENWGAITFREVLLIYDKKKTSTAVKKRIAEVIAHELWHQWSGNLVTMEWWDDLWLNESFATYMAFKAVHHYYPEYKMWEDFVNSETSGALEADSLKSTHPIAVKVKTPNEVEEIFDQISYGKGGSVLRMIDSYLGKEKFRQGVSNYLKKYEYANAKAADLWNELSKVSKDPIKEVLESWISQRGHPILEINNLKVSQKKFSHLPEKTNQKWKIPLTILTKKGVSKKLLTKNGTIPENFLKLNVDQEGFYRVSYSRETLEKMKPLILEKKLSTFDRWGLQHDLFDLTTSGDKKISDYLEFLDAYKNEDSFLVLSDIWGNLHEISRRFPDFKPVLLKETFQRNLAKLGFKPRKKDKEDEKLLRALCINYLSFIRDPIVLKKVYKMFRKPNKIPADLKGVVYTSVSRTGGEKEFSKLLDLYKKSTHQEEKVKLLAAISRTGSPELLEKLLDFSLTNSVRLQDLRTVFGNVEINRNADKIVFQWIKRNWPKLSKLQKTHFVFMGLLEMLILPYTGKKNKSKLKSFLNSKKIQYKKTQANAFEKLDINTRWIENNKFS